MVIIFGLGFTGKRLALRLLRNATAEGRAPRVFAAVRGVERFPDLTGIGLTAVEITDARHGVPALPKGATVVHLIPPVPDPDNLRIRNLIESVEPARVVYISATSVYGDQLDVDENSIAQPGDERSARRAEEERWVAAGAWSSLILRAAAIYGPGRGVHTALREGRIPRSAGSGIVSRIHVDDLAALAEAGIQSELRGAWPVADDTPCSSAEIADWCAVHLRLENLRQTAQNFPIAGRRVNGVAIREKLGIALTYPSWQAGLLACFEEEQRAAVSPKVVA